MYRCCRYLIYIYWRVLLVQMLTDPIKLKDVIWTSGIRVALEITKLTYGNRTLSIYQTLFFLQHYFLCSKNLTLLICCSGLKSKYFSMLSIYLSFLRKYIDH